MATTDDRLLIATRKGCFEARRRGRTWALQVPQLRGQTVAYAVLDPRNGSIWASLDHGHWGAKLSRSTNDGRTFEEIPPPRYPEATGQSARYYWVLQPGVAEEPEVFWIGTEPGGLFASPDNGATWALNQPLWDLRVKHKWQGGGRDHAGIHSICLHPSDPSRAWVGVSCAGVLETKDRGESWTYVNKGMTEVFHASDPDFAIHDPHCLTMAPSNPDVLWQANHMGVFRSSDGARQWQNLTQKPYVNFGFPIAVHPQRPERAWIVPLEGDEGRMPIDGRLVVMRTDDGGATWQETSEGLPQQNAFDFPYRHGFDVGTGGETLAFGTTSGNLYTSGDGGASWSAVATSLPPIYSLRFA